MFKISNRAIHLVKSYRTSQFAENSTAQQGNESKPHLSTKLVPASNEIATDHKKGNKNGTDTSEIERTDQFL